MNYYGGKNMADSWRTVRNNTIQIAEEIPAEQYGFRATPETMSVGEILAHLAANPHFNLQANLVDRKSNLAMPDLTRYFGEANALAATLQSKDAIVDALKRGRDELASGLEGVDDESLGEPVTLPNGTRTRFEMLLSVKEHEMHHRGQLMTMQRMMGIVPHLTRARQERLAAAPR